MSLSSSLSIKLGSFEGSLEYLVHLIQKKEVDPLQIPLLSITRPFLEGYDSQEDGYEMGSDFIVILAQLALIKSRALSPTNEKVEALSIEEDDKFGIIHHLIDYCLFKETAQSFAKMEDLETDFYPRGIADQEVKLPCGLDTVSLDELSSLFKTLLINAEAKWGTIEEEEWRVQDKIEFLGALLKEKGEFTFESLFFNASCKEEMIVIFLAVLELVKGGALKIARKNSEIIIINGQSV